jgi:hypothetical protein
MAAQKQTPGDDASPQSASAIHPTKGRRFRVMGAGEGDYCIYQIAPQDSQLPQGALVPLPEVPRFENHAGAMKWVRNDSGDLLAGKQVMVFCAHEILTITVENRPKVSINAKPKVQISGPEKA